MADVIARDGGDIESHTEGVLLFSDSRSCYGRSLDEIIDELRSDIWGYGDTIEAEPHSDGWGMLQAAIEEPEAHKYLLDNSVWLIHHECLQDDEYCKDFLYLIRGVPSEANIVVWIDASGDQTDRIDREISTAYPGKVTVVPSERELKQALRSYLDQAINPRRGRTETIRKWKRKVQEKKDDIG